MVSDVNLHPYTTALVSAADEDGDGTVDYQELTTLMFETLMQLDREHHVRDVAFTSADSEIK